MAQRPISFKIRFSEEEYQVLQAKADELGLPISNLVRMWIKMGCPLSQLHHGEQDHS
jgi:hypothetical protein